MCLGDCGQSCKWLSLMMVGIMLGFWLRLKWHAGSCGFEQVGCHATLWPSWADSIRVLPVGPWTFGSVVGSGSLRVFGGFGSVLAAAVALRLVCLWLFQVVVSGVLWTFPDGLRLIWGHEVFWFWSWSCPLTHSCVGGNQPHEGIVCSRPSSAWGRFGFWQFWRLPVSGKWLGLIALGHIVRVGEATVPGPDGSIVQFKLGVCNPNGLYDKGSCFADSDVDIWAISETHLTSKGLSSFRALLRTQAWLVCSWKSSAS